MYTDDELLVLKNFGNRLRELRHSVNLSQEKLAFKADLDRTYIGSIERGERNVSLINIVRIAQTLDVNICDFFKKR